MRGRGRDAGQRSNHQAPDGPRPSSRSAHGLHDLQQLVGNGAVERLVGPATSSSPLPVQAKFSTIRFALEGNSGNRGSNAAYASILTLLGQGVTLQTGSPSTASFRQQLSIVDRVVGEVPKAKSTKRKVKESRNLALESLGSALATERVTIENQWMKFSSTEWAKAVAPTLTVAQGVTKMIAAGLPLKDVLDGAAAGWKPVPFAAVKPAIDKADKKAKDAAWADEKLLGRCRASMDDNEYLDLLPALGMVKTGVTEEDGKSHTPADKADEYIRAQLATYVAGAVKAGKQVAGQIAVVDGADWDLAYEKEFGDDGEQDVTNAFVDHWGSGRIWLHKERGNAGTAIHEGMHKYSTASLINQSQPLNEGVTEYFTRKVCNNLTPKVVRGNYQSNFEVSKTLVDLVGESVVAKAYFDGDVAGLKKAVLSAGVTAANWKAFLSKTETNEWADADELLRPAVAEAALGDVASMFGGK